MAEQVGLTPWASLRGGSISSVLSFFFFGAPFFSPLFFVSRHVLSLQSTSRTWYLYPVLSCCTTYYVYLACICTFRDSWVLLPLLQLLCVRVVAVAAAAAVRRRVPEGKNCCWFVKSDSIRCCLSFQTQFFFSCLYPLAVLPRLR